MIWQQIGEAALTFFSGVGIIGTFLVAFVFFGIRLDERKAKKQERARRERNWDWQEKRIDRLSEQLSQFRADMRAAMEIVNSQADAIEELQARVELHGATLDIASKVADVMAGKMRSLQANVTAHDEILLDHTAAITTLTDNQRSTDAWESITDRQLDRLESDISDLQDAVNDLDNRKAA